MNLRTRFVSLVGLKHVGKTSVARLLAAEHAFRAYDLDDAVLVRARFDGDFPPTRPGEPPIRALYRALGADRFRSYERDALVDVIMAAEELPDSNRVVVSTGGGIADNPEALEILARDTTILYLHGDPLLLYERIAERGIPAFLDPARPRDHFLEIATRREELYRRIADGVIEVAVRSPADVAREIALLEQT